jgi:hypothetical protein
MAFLSNYQYDIFISYARVDNQVVPGEKEGWISRFESYLKIELSRRVGRMDLVKIWRDPELVSNQFFDEAIQQTINNSALFLALTSRGFLAPAGYCQNELKWFHQKAQTEPCGLKIGTRSRIFNLRLTNIPYQQLPVEFAGTTGCTFYDEVPGRMAMPLPPGEKLFEGQMRQLADELFDMLHAFKEVLEPTPLSPQAVVDEAALKVPDEVAPKNEDAFRVFLADTADNLRRTTYKRVLSELTDNGVRVITDVPPPYPAKLHEEKVCAEIKNAKLSVHLFDGEVSRDIEGEPGKSYPQKQAEIGLQCAASQLIWVPKLLDLQTIEDEAHRNFLAQLETGQRDGATYRFVRESPAAIAREILAQIEQLKVAEKDQVARLRSAALLDTHMKDQLHALDLYPLLVQKQVQPYINPEADEPQKSFERFEALLKQVSVLIIIFGNVAGEWVRERLITALQVASGNNCPLKLCGIYAPPSDNSATRRLDLGVFPASLPIFLFYTPQMLSDLLDKFLGK